MKIQRVNWDIAGSNMAVWPSPVDADECFQKAGFTEFADSDNEWDEEFQSFLVSAISLAETYGPPTVRRFAGIKGIPNPSPREVLEAAAFSDEFGPAIVEFGDPSAVTLITADQHPIIWFVPCPDPDAPESIVESLAAGRPVVRYPLKWEHLIPVGVQTKDRERGIR